MKKHNTWVQCLNCGNEYWADDILYAMDAVSCPGCTSVEYVEIEPLDQNLKQDFQELNESLLKDGEWD